MKSGVCSITFAQLAPSEVVALVKQAGLDAIEWAGNAHVQPGERQVASDVRNMTGEAGLAVSSYGSYWKAVDADGSPVPFEPVLESALALGTDTIRIWAGHQPSDAATREERDRIYEGIRGALAAAEAQGVRLALEFHSNTLADSNASTARVLEEIGHPNLYTYWQPIYWLTDSAYRLEGLRRLADRVLNLHVFYWQFSPGAGSWGESIDRRPLDEVSGDWREYLSVPLVQGLPHYALLEFVRNDDPDRFLRDARVLKGLLAE